MRTASLIAGFLLIIQPTIDVAWAADPVRDTVIGNTVRQEARAIPGQVIDYSGAIVLPPCSNGIQLLLRCMPRAQIVFDPRDVEILNKVAVEHRPRRRPYTQNFSWD